MTDAHVNYVKNHDAHTATSGCIIYCIGTYSPGEAHSHRWHAANRARGESRVPYSDYPAHIRLWRPLTSFTRIQASGGVAGAVTPDGNTYTANVSAFHHSESPFPHNAHHIIPSSNIEKYVDKVAAKAGNNSGRMRDLVVGGLLAEPYNNNDEPNMIVMPTQLEASQVLGLPLHTDGRPDHPKYRKMVGKQLKSKFVRMYRSLSAAVRDEDHPKDQKIPTAGPMMVAISKATYEAIISVAQGKRGAGQTLDAMSRELLRLSRRSASA